MHIGIGTYRFVGTWVNSFRRFVFVPIKIGHSGIFNMVLVTYQLHRIDKLLFHLVS